LNVLLINYNSMSLFSADCLFLILFLLITLDPVFVLISRFFSRFCLLIIPFLIIFAPFLVLIGCDQELLFETLFDREEEIETQMGVGAGKAEAEILGVLGKEECADVLLVVKVLLDETKAASCQTLEETRSAAPPFLPDDAHAIRKVILAEDGQQGRLQRDQSTRG